MDSRDEEQEQREPLVAEDLLEEVVMALVTKPEAVSVSEDRYPDNAPYMAIKCAPEDVGAVLGYDGETIKALRRIFSTVGRREGRKLFLDIDKSIRDPAYDDRRAKMVKPKRQTRQTRRRRQGGNDSIPPALKSASAGILNREF